MPGRGCDRARVQLEVALEASGLQVFTPALNLSASGILLASDAPPEVGSPVRIVMSLPPDGIFVRLQGRVVRHARAGQRAAFAVVFLATDEGTVSELRSVVQAASA